MTTVPYEYAWVASVSVYGLSAFSLAVLEPHIPWLIVPVLTALSFVLYCFSPLPQGWRRPNTPPRKRKWGFEVEYTEDRVEHALRTGVEDE